MSSWFIDTLLNRKMASDKPNEDDFEFNWLQARKNVGLPDLSGFDEETATEKFKRKFKDNPLVPIGALFTTICLTMGLMSMRRGDMKMSQMMMRGRILAQGFTVAALVSGICFKASESFLSSDDK